MNILQPLYQDQKLVLAPAWSKADVASRLYLKWTGKNIQNKPHEHIKTLAEKIAQHIKQNFSGWEELGNDPSKALNIIDQALQSIDKSFPLLSKM